MSSRLGQQGPCGKQWGPGASEPAECNPPAKHSDFKCSKAPRHPNRRVLRPGSSLAKKGHSLSGVSGIEDSRFSSFSTSEIDYVFWSIVCHSLSGSNNGTCHRQWWWGKTQSIGPRAPSAMALLREHAGETGWRVSQCGPASWEQGCWDPVYPPVTFPEVAQLTFPVQLGLSPVTFRHNHHTSLSVSIQTCKPREDK